MYNIATAKRKGAGDYRDEQLAGNNTATAKRQGAGDCRDEQLAVYSTATAKRQGAGDCTETSSSQGTTSLSSSSLDTTPLPLNVKELGTVQRRAARRVRHRYQAARCVQHRYRQTSRSWRLDRDEQLAGYNTATTKCQGAGACRVVQLAGYSIAIEQLAGYSTATTKRQAWT